VDAPANWLQRDPVPIRLMIWAVIGRRQRLTEVDLHIVAAQQRTRIDSFNRQKHFLTARARCAFEYNNADQRQCTERRNNHNARACLDLHVGLALPRSANPAIVAAIAHSMNTPAVVMRFTPRSVSSASAAPIML